MPSSQAAATERRNERIVTHEPPKLKTTLKTPPKQATNPLQFVKVGPCSLYRTAQEQLQKVQEVKKIKPEVRDDPEDWQSNLDNWKSSRRKRQEHIIERVVEVKKLELEEHDRQRRRSKTFSEMMEERGSRGRKLSMSLAMYHEEDANDLSDLGIGTSSGKSSVSGDTHDDMQSVLSDRDSEIEKNHSDVENATSENGNANENNNISESSESTSTKTTSSSLILSLPSIAKKPPVFGNGFHDNDNDNPEYDSATTATASSPEPEEYTYEGAIRGYVSRVSQNIPRRSLVNLDAKLESAKPTNANEEKSVATSDEKSSSSSLPAVKVDVLKRREIFEKSSQNSAENKANTINNNLSNNNNNNNNNKNNGRSASELTSAKSIKERLSSLEKQTSEMESSEKDAKAINRLSGDMSSIRERLSHLEKQTSERENKVSHRKMSSDELESVRPLRERLSTLEKYANSSEPSSGSKVAAAVATSIKDRLVSLDATRKSIKESLGKKTAPPVDKQLMRFVNEETRVCDNSTPSERSSSPDSEYRAAPRAAFHRSLDSLDADASSGPDTFERVQSLEELDYTNRYPASSSSAELLNDTDREDSGIHTADVSCSVSQADEPVDEEVLHHPETILERQESSLENGDSEEASVREIIDDKSDESNHEKTPVDSPQEATAVTTKDTADTTSSSTPGILSNNKYKPVTNLESSGKFKDDEKASSPRPIVYQSPRVPPRRTPPDAAKPKSSESSETVNAISVVICTKTEVSAESEELACGGSGGAVGKHSSNSQDAKRTASKIPTPLPRKSLSVKLSAASSSPPSTASPAKTAPPPPKFTGKLTAGHSKIPFSTATNPAKPSEDSGSSEKLQTERRRTVVEVCEKVLVSPGETPTSPPATPFITVLRVGQEQRSNEESIVIDSADEEAESPVEASLSVDHEEPRTDGQAMDLVALADSLPETSNSANQQHKEQQQVYEIQEEPEIASLATLIPLPAQTSPISNNKLTFEKPDVSSLQQNTIDFFSTLSPSSKQIPQLNLTSNEEFFTGMTFPLGPPTSVEPPKEKPPPPPTDLSDEENLPVEPLKRLNSTRRIKKELRTRRSDFLGIEGINDDELERELTLTKPPDMAAILAEERRIEQLHRRSYDTDSNYEQDSSHERDSGVELGHAEDWSKQPVSPDMSQHSRQSSEPFGASVTSSEEDEITKKEREIIEVLEKEEQWRYGNDREQNSDIGEKLAHKLRELEEEKMQLERERAQETELRRQEETLRKNDENALKQEEDTLRKEQQQQDIVRQQQQEAERAAETAKRVEEKRLREDELLRIETEQLRIQGEIAEKERRSAEVRRQEDMRIRSMEGQIRIHEQMAMSVKHEEELASGEVLRVERELLQLEQEELKRQRTKMAYREQRQLQLAEQLQEQWQSLQDVANGSINGKLQTPSHYKYQAAPVNYRSSMPNLQLQEGQRRRPPPPPIPPSKPSRLVEQMQRDVTIRNSRIPSADSIPQQVDSGGLRHSASATTLSSHAGQQMTKQTLHALSAVPRSRIVKGDQWVQRRKSDVPRATQEYNYQHWLIQEAEQRRISEKNQRTVVRKPQQHVTGTSVPYTTSPSSRTDGKPLPDSIIQTLTQRVQNRAQERPPPPRRRLEQSTSHEHLSTIQHQSPQHAAMLQHQKVHPFSAGSKGDSQEKMLSVSGKKKCSHCGDELGRGAAMIIESLRLFYHMECFKCCVCHVRLGDGLMGTDVRVRNHKLHCHNCYSSDDGVKFSCV